MIVRIFCTTDTTGMMSRSSTPPLVSKMERAAQSPSSQETPRTPSQCLSHPAIPEIRVPAHPGTLTIHHNSMPEQLASVQNSERAPYVHITHSLRQTLITNYTPAQTLSEKIDGLKEEIKGKIKHDPELVEHGREKRTGELKRNEMRQVDSFPSLADHLTKSVFRRTLACSVSLARLIPTTRNNERSSLARSSLT